MEATVLVDPSRCRIWTMHGRLEEHINAESCAEEIESFKEHGQLLPVLGRPVRDDPEYNIEVICGARRLFVARHLRVSLLAEIRELSDREAIIAMELENRQRKDLSPYERGVYYAQLLRGGYFQSQEDMAGALKVSTSQISRLLKVARLPSAIVAAFDGAIDIRENWGLALSEFMQDPERRQSAIRAAREIRETVPHPAAREVYRRLLASAARGRKPNQIGHDKVVKGKNGDPLFRIRHQRGAVALLIPVERTSAKSLDAIERALLRILEGAEEKSHARVLRQEGQDLPVSAHALRRDAELPEQLTATVT